MTRLSFPCEACFDGTIDAGFTFPAPRSQVIDDDGQNQRATVIGTCRSCRRNVEITLTALPEQGVLNLGG